MTSEERRAGRRKRREQARAEKRAAALAPYDNYENVICLSSLLKAAKQSKRGVAWKASVQRFWMCLMMNLWSLHAALEACAKVTQGFICFWVQERGKRRRIRSVHFRERVVQRSVCDNALVPALKRSFVNDNGASLKGKGIHFAMYRCRKQLRAYWRKHKTNTGWVMQIDFSGYFDNILHEPLRRLLETTFRDKRLLRLIWQFIAAFGDKSLGLGSQVSQILALAYPSHIDHYLREVRRLGLGGRYNDDSYYFHHDKEYLEKCLEDVRRMCAEIGITLNPTKTQIIPLKRFTFLKVRYRLTETGKVVMKPNTASFARERRKLRAFAEQVRSGEMTLEQVERNYNSWRGYVSKTDCHKALRDMDKYYYELFGKWPTQKKKKRKKVHV